MKKTILMTLLLCLQAVLLSANVPDSIRMFDRHIIILVDQSANAQSPEIGRDIVSLLKDGAEESGWGMAFAPVNPGSDEVSLYAFGLTGPHCSSILASKVQGSLTPDNYFDIVSKLLVYKRTPFSESGKDFASYCDGDVMRLFDGSDPLYEEMRAKGYIGPVSLSQYAQECALSRFTTKTPAKEYIMIAVSDFRSGISDIHSSSDRMRVKELVGEQSLPEQNCMLTKGFDRQADAATEGLNVIRMFNIIQGGQVAVASRIVPEALIGTSAYVATGIKIEQESYKGSEYDIRNIRIAFPHTSGSVAIDKIVMRTDNNGKASATSTIAGNREEAEGLYDATAQSYDVPDFDSFDLGAPFDEGVLGLNFILLGNTYNNDGKALLPFAFEASQSIDYDNNLSKTAPTMAYMIIAIILIALIVTFLIWYNKKSYRDGLNAATSLRLDIWPVSNSRYMDVSGMKVTDYDCWYWRGGADRSRSILITGSVNYSPRRWAKQFARRIEYMIIDADDNPDFSFRPDGHESNGDLRKAEVWYRLDDAQAKSLQKDGQFQIQCIAYLENGVTPNFTMDNILRLQVKIRLSLVDAHGKVVAEQKDSIEKNYSFIVKPDIENSSLWMAFDPGTSGSCVAYGNGGLPDRKDHIHLAYNRTQASDGSWRKESIFPSMIYIPASSGLFDGTSVEATVESMDGGKGDFNFGNLAKIYGGGTNTFQSIKKLLGYTKAKDMLPITRTVNGVQQTRMLLGEDLAHLVVKGLCNHFKDYITTDADAIKNGGRDAFYSGAYAPGVPFTPSRAIVAVPNNYTMVKVQAMVNTVKRTGLFKEVHYIYESEGTLMTYLQHNWAQLPEVADRLFVVFDMGGATINATAFRIKVTLGSDGNINNVEVRTVSKIGFCVGGDDIDFALIKMTLEATKLFDYADKVEAEKHEKAFMRAHKRELLDMAFRLKLGIIDIHNNPNDPAADNVMASDDSLWSYVSGVFSNMGKELDDSLIRDGFLAHFDSERKTHKTLKHYVLDKVAEAVAELINGLDEDVSGCPVELILSGRSTLYPGVKESVIGEINRSSKYRCEREWDGFNNSDGELDADKVKTCVANGACWYAMFSKFITMRHDIVTSTFGYLDMINNKTRFVPLIERNSQFDENGKCRPDRKLRPADALNYVEFLQLFGSNYDEIIDNDIKYKKTVLAKVMPAEIISRINAISIEVDNKDNFAYAIDIAGLTEPLTGNSTAKNADINDENSEAYVFATLQPDNDDKPATKTARAGRGNRTGRF